MGEGNDLCFMLILTKTQFPILQCCKRTDRARTNQLYHNTETR
jgi:hypothetical protein